MQLKRIQYELRQRYRGRCGYCQHPCDPFGADTLRASTIDHYYPQSKEGGWHRHNLVLCCWKCNNEKGNMLPVAWYALHPTYSKPLRDDEKPALPLTRLERKIAALQLIAQRVRGIA